MLHKASGSGQVEEICLLLFSDCSELSASMRVQCPKKSKVKKIKL